MALRDATLDRLNRGSGVLIDSDNPSDNVLNAVTLRAYGGGSGPVRSLDLMLSMPQPPLNPGLAFSRIKQSTGLSTAITLSDLKTSRWDYLATDAISPHIAVGGDKIVYVGVDTDPACVECQNAGGYPIQGIYIKTLGQDDAQRLTAADLFALTPRISPDQTKIAFAAVTVNPDEMSAPSLSQPAQIYVMDIDGLNRQQLTSDIEYPSSPGPSVYGNYAPAWSPDGAWIAFQRTTFDGANGDLLISQLVRLRPNEPEGSRSTLVDFASTGIAYIGQPSWAPGGDTVFFSGIPSEADGNYELFGLGLQTNAITRVTDNAVQDVWPAVSYDGRFLAHVQIDGSDAELNVLDRYNGSLVTTLGNFAAAGEYGELTFTGTDAALAAISGIPTDGTGTALITAPDARLLDSPEAYNYYEDIMPDAGTPGVDYSLPGWY
jgi:Tol biopolymer transport system component